MKTRLWAFFLVLTLTTLMQNVRPALAQDVQEGPQDQGGQPGGMAAQAMPVAPGGVVVQGQSDGNNGPVMMVVPATAFDPNAADDQGGQGGFQGGQGGFQGGQGGFQGGQGGFQGGQGGFQGGQDVQGGQGGFQGRQNFGGRNRQFGGNAQDMTGNQGQQQDQGGGRQQNQRAQGQMRQGRNMPGMQRNSNLRPGGMAQQPVIDPKALKLEMFINMKNIFDPQRRPPVSEVRATPTPVPTERVALTGVLIDGNQTPAKAVAVFEGSQDQYNCVVEKGGIIAGQRLVEVLGDRVKLQGTTTLDLPIACQITRQGQGEWQVTSSTMVAYNAEESSLVGRRALSTFGGGQQDFGNQFGGGGGRGGRFGNQQQDFGNPFGGGNQFGGGGGRGGRNRQFGGGGQQDFGNQFGGGGGRGGRFGGGQFGGGGQDVVVTSPAPTPAPAPPMTAASQDELIKQMMEKRKKELGQ